MGNGQAAKPYLVVNALSSPIVGGRCHVGENARGGWRVRQNGRCDRQGGPGQGFKAAGSRRVLGCKKDWTDGGDGSAVDTPESQVMKTGMGKGRQVKTNVQQERRAPQRIANYTIESVHRGHDSQLLHRQALVQTLLFSSPHLSLLFRPKGWKWMRLLVWKAPKYHKGGSMELILARGTGCGQASRVAKCHHYWMGTAQVSNELTAEASSESRESTKPGSLGVITSMQEPPKKRLGAVSRLEPSHRRPIEPLD